MPSTAQNFINTDWENRTTLKKVPEFINEKLVPKKVNNWTWRSAIDARTSC